MQIAGLGGYNEFARIIRFWMARKKVQLPILWRVVKIDRTDEKLSLAAAAKCFSEFNSITIIRIMDVHVC